MVLPPPDPADATDMEDRDGGLLLGDIILFGILTGNTESAGVFLGDVTGGTDTAGGAGPLSSSFFSSGMDAFGRSFEGFVTAASLDSSAFSGVTCVAILEDCVFCVTKGIKKKNRVSNNMQESTNPL